MLLWAIIFFRYFEHWAPFVVCLGWNTVVDSSIVAKYSFFCWKTHCSLAGNGKGGCSRLVVVFSLGSSPTVETENRVKRLQPNVNSPLFRFRPTSNEVFKSAELWARELTLWIVHIHNSKFVSAFTPQILLNHITALSDYSLIHFSQFNSSRFED